MAGKILISGGSGLIGMELSALLKENNYEVAHLTRNKKSDFPYRQFEWDIPAQQMEDGAIAFADAIIHLAGENVAGGRWTEKRRKKIVKSRTESAALLKKEIAKAQKKPQHFISASGINYYGMDTGNRLLTEDDPPGDGFLANVCEKWEQATDEIGETGIKTAKVRTGIVLSDLGGALPQIAKPIKFWVGAPLGSGKQYMSWIHIQDLCGIYLHILKKELTGTYNGVAPNPVTNKKFTKETAKQLNKPLWLPNVPAFAMKLALGEMAEMILGGVKGSSEKIESEGYRFKFKKVEAALKDIYG